MTSIITEVVPSTIIETVPLPSVIESATGPAGPAGAPGAPGAPGTPGAPGDQGPPGASGDRYATTSVTSLSISLGTKTLTVETGLSYSPQQEIIIADGGNNHMHALVTSYDSGSGIMVVDVNKKTGSGTYSSWTVNLEAFSGADHEHALLIDMASANVTLNSGDSQNSVMIISNPGDGTKVITVNAAEHNPVRYSFINNGTEPVRITSGEGNDVVVFGSLDAVYVFGSGFYFTGSEFVICNKIGSFPATVTPSSIEQVLSNFNLPMKSLSKDGDSILVEFMIDKSGVDLQTMTRITFGTTGGGSVGGDTPVWAVQMPNIANDAMYTMVKLTRTSATKLALSTLPGWYVPFNASATTFVEYTVPNLNTTNLKVSISSDGTGGTNTETVTLRRVRALIQK